MGGNLPSQRFSLESVMWGERDPPDSSIFLENDALSRNFAGIASHEFLMQRRRERAREGERGRAEEYKARLKGGPQVA